MATLETRSQVGLARAASRPAFPGPLRGVTAHWNGPAMSLAGKAHTECQRRWRGIQRFHMGRNHPDPQHNGRHWQDVAYSAAVCHHEIVMEGRGKGVRTAANGTNAGNNSWYAIFFMLGGNEEPSTEMLRAAAWYARHHLGTTNWNRHTDHKATTCAGTVNKYISGGNISTSGQASGGGGTGGTMLRQGSKGSEVRAWQRQLLQWNSNALPRFGADGDFGGETDDWTKRFQRSAGIGVDGIVGPQTRSAMESALKPAPEPTPSPSKGGPFEDVPADSSHADTWQQAKELGLFTGYRDGTVRPNQQATRAEIAVVAVRLYNLLSD